MKKEYRTMKNNDLIIQNLITLSNNLPIELVIENEGIKLSGFGDVKKAVSPFRSSKKNTSFTVSKMKNMWTDWVLKEEGYSGGPIRFIEKLYGFRFLESVKFLSYKYSLESVNTLNEIFSVNYRKKTIQKMKRFVYSDFENRNLEFKVADQAKKNKAYIIFKEFCGISKKDREYLIHRMGESVYEKYKNCFFSMPNKHKLKVFQKFIKKKGLKVKDFEYVPGFYIKDEQVQFNTLNGIGITILDENENIQGIQVRMAKGNLRYVWFSSSNYIDLKGSSPFSPAHLIKSCKKNKKNVLFITEGVFKAISLNHHFNSRAISVQGVGNTLPAISMIEKSGAKIIYIAYDADVQTNESVRLQMFKLKQRIEELGCEARILIWDETSGKGIDDVIAMGNLGEVRVLTKESL